jgi:hypothetical protein
VSPVIRGTLATGEVSIHRPENQNQIMHRGDTIKPDPHSPDFKAFWTELVTNSPSTTGEKVSGNAPKENVPGKCSTALLHICVVDRI